MQVLKMRASVLPRAPAMAGRAAARTWMLPSAITSAPKLTMASTTRSAPRAYTCWPERSGLSITTVPGPGRHFDLHLAHHLAHLDLGRLVARLRQHHLGHVDQAGGHGGGHLRRVAAAHRRQHAVAAQRRDQGGEVGAGFARAPRSGRSPADRWRRNRACRRGGGQIGPSAAASVVLITTATKGRVALLRSKLARAGARGHTGHGGL
jgi:hypothetical protein